MALAGLVRRALDPAERRYGALRAGEEWRSLPQAVRADRVAILNRIKDGGLGKVLGEFFVSPRRAGVRRYGPPGPMPARATPRPVASDAEGSFEFLRTTLSSDDPTPDPVTAEGQVRSLYVARLFDRAAQTFERHLGAVARSRAGAVAFETLRAYSLSLVRTGRAGEADDFLTELATSFPSDPDVICCLAIIRMTLDPASAVDLFARAIALGQERQLALNFLVALLVERGEETAAIRHRLDAPLRSHARRAEAKGDTALLDALLSAAEGDTQAQLFHLNRCLTFQRVGRLALRDASRPLSPWNLAAAQEMAEARGPLVSILVTTFNSAAFVEGSLRSLLEQTYRNLEIVVCDDASQDDTAAIVQRLGREDPRIRLLTNKKNVGTYASKNAAVLQSDGGFVTCHDSDDWAHPQKIEMQVDSLLARPGRVGSRSLWVRVDEHCRPILANWGAFLHANPASLLLRREVFDAVGLFDSVRVAADSEFLNRVRLVFGAESISTVRACLSLGLDRAESLTRSSAFGFSVEQRSPAREAYWAAWADWHIGAGLDELRLQFPLPRRPFAVPSDIHVPENDIRVNLGLEP